MLHVTGAAASETSRCSVCAAAPLRFFFRRNGLEFLRCAACGCAFQTPPAQARRYEDEYYLSLGANSEACRRVNAQALARLAGAPRPGADRLLDVGCGLGEFLEQARLAGWRAEGCDLPAAASARRLRGVQYGPPESWRYDEASFDVAAAFNVVEHVADPAALLDRLARWLKPGGRLLLLTPDLASWSARLLGKFWPHFHREHVVYFPGKTLVALLERRGFGVVEPFPWRKRVTPGFLLEQAARYFPDVAPAPLTRLLGAAPGWALSLPLTLPSGSVGLVARRRA